MVRLRFDAVFTIHEDDTIEPTQRLRVGGITIGPGVRFSRGMYLGGIDFTQYQGHDLEIAIDNDIIVITGIY